MLNTWEAVYFATDLDHLKRLADTAASIGVERFVLDDGWFGSRRDDHRGLGDWQVSADVWPDGLGPLVDHVKGLGLEFGLWFEPEMVNLDSDVARAHPEWVLAARWRARRCRPAASTCSTSRTPMRSTYVLEAMSAVIGEYAVDFVKWDHNRDLHEAVRTDATGTDRPGRARPDPCGLPRCSTSCAPGTPTSRSSRARAAAPGSTSACSPAPTGCGPPTATTPSSGSHIQRWTGLLVPPELMGSHVGPPRAHTTHRDLDLSLRMLVAARRPRRARVGHHHLHSRRARGAPGLVGALPRAATAAALAATSCGSDHPGRRTCFVSGVVAPDGADAVFTVVSTVTGRGVTPGHGAAAGAGPATAATGCGCARRPACPPWCRRRPRPGGGRRRRRRPRRERGRPWAGCGLAAARARPGAGLPARTWWPSQGDAPRVRRRGSRHRRVSPRW